MTGYGRGTAGEPHAIVVEVRAVNHRFCDIKFAAGVTPTLAEPLTKLLREHVARGALTVSVDERGGAALALDVATVHAVHAELEALAARLGTSPPTLELVLSHAASRRAGSAGAEAPERIALVLRAAEIAVAALVRHRGVEGEALAAAMTELTSELEQVVATLEQAAAAQPAAQRARLAQRVASLLGSVEALDATRLAQEVALLVERADITEELVRLRAHLAEVRACLLTHEPVGRRLDFLAQELGREFNTIGAKAASAEISHAVVEGKSVLEKLREQIQNVE